MKRFEDEKSNFIRITRTVYSKVDLNEIERNADSVGARIVRMSTSPYGVGFSVILEVDLRRRQF